MVVGVRLGCQAEQRTDSKAARAVAGVRVGGAASGMTVRGVAAGRAAAGSWTVQRLASDTADGREHGTGQPAEGLVTKDY